MKKLAEKIYALSPIWSQNLMVSVYGYALYRKRYFGLYQEVLKDLERVGKMADWEVSALQDEKLHFMVGYCKQNVPFYGELFAKFGISPNDITSVSDIKKLPILDKETVRNNSDLLRPEDSEAAYFVQHTSGSTGTPLTIHLNEYTYKLAMALLVEHERSHGINFGERRATFAGRLIQSVDNTRPPFSRFNRSENQRIFSSYHLSAKTFPFYKAELSKFQPVELIGYPSALSELASLYEEFNVSPDYGLKAIITNSETLLEWQRSLIERVFSCRVYDYYGTAEYVVFAGQSSDSLYYPNPLLGVTEVLTDGSQEKAGRVIATTLTNTAMPLLRYDTADKAAVSALSQSFVGAPVIQSFNGRQDDYIETLDKRKIGRIDHIFKGITGIVEAQVVQKAPGQAVVNIARDSSGSFDAGSLIENIKLRLGHDFKVDIEYVKKVKRGANGKLKSVIREY